MLEPLYQFIKGMRSRSDAAAILNLRQSQFNYLVRKEGFSEETHIWLKGIGFVLKIDRPFWQNQYDLYYQGMALEVLAHQLGITDCPLRTIFRSLGFPLRSQVEVKKAVAKKLMREHGVTNVGALLSVRKKRAETMVQRYGVENASLSKELCDKRKQTFISRYGVDNISKLESVQEKIRQKSRNTRGVEHHLQDLGVVFKRSETRLLNRLPSLLKSLAERGCELLEPFQGFATKDLEERKRSTWKYYKLKHLACGKIFEKSLLSPPICPYCFPFTDYRSVLERDYQKFLEELGIHVEHGKKALNYGGNIRGDIDILVTSHNVGFEINGLYWHSVNDKGAHPKTSNYHFKKSAIALSQGIRLYHIWEHHPQHIVKSMLCNIFGRPQHRLYARHLTFSPILPCEGNTFLLANHLLGTSPAYLFFALKNQVGQPVSVISFRRLSDVGTYEIARFASLLNHQILGGFSKLLKHALPFLPGLRRLITYADRDWSPDHTQTVYFKQGFTFLGDSGPSMFYTDFSAVWSRHHFMKHKLPRLFPATFNPALSEQENLSLQSIYPFYTSGNWKFERTF